MGGGGCLIFWLQGTRYTKSKERHLWNLIQTCSRHHQLHILSSRFRNVLIVDHRLKYFGIVKKIQCMIRHHKICMRENKQNEMSDSVCVCAFVNALIISPTSFYSLVTVSISIFHFCLASFVKQFVILNVYLKQNRQIVAFDIEAEMIINVEENCH